jgi:Protein of unknown function (DUF429)
VLCRRDLANHVRTKPGWWVFDFPFGVARESVAAILGTPCPSWQGWLEWCASQGNATKLRDQARQRKEAAQVPWSTRRQVDREYQTTWFPLFEMLYKQTIYGAGQVLLPMLQSPRNEICILPWHDLDDTPVVVIEGFPGVTIRQRLGLASSGYKGRRVEHQQARQRIINVLKGEPYCLPIPPDVERRALADIEGDAVDALVLLIAAWVSQALDPALWRESREDLEEDERLGEGWFPV